MTKTAKKENFEGSLESLESVVRELEAGDKGLEESLELFEKGITIAKNLSKQLEEAKKKVEVLTKDGGKLVKAPLKEDD
ncbi:MAG: exodeoxyribonuclease VII small subunit [Elusimicrobia bacterium]|nr:exodeoxyribonuclease VII small subunit [Elusimicrobiota bacterium]